MFGLRQEGDGWKTNSHVDEGKISPRPVSTQIPLTSGHLQLCASRRWIFDSLVLLPRWRMFGECSFPGSLIPSNHRNELSLVLLLYVWMFACMHVCVLRARLEPVEARTVYQIPWTGITGGFKPPCGWQERNTCSLQGQQMLLVKELSLQPLEQTSFLYFLRLENVYFYVGRRGVYVSMCVQTD